MNSVAFHCVPSGSQQAQVSTLCCTSCAPVIHGSGGGHDQGMAFARPLTQHGIRVIADTSSRSPASTWRFHR
jgi:hypothetical protein